MNAEKSIKQLREVHVPHRFEMTLWQAATLVKAPKGPFETALLAFKFGYLQGQRAAKAEALKNRRKEIQRHALGYGALEAIIEQNMSNEKFIHWVHCYAKNLDAAWKQVVQAEAEREARKND